MIKLRHLGDVLLSTPVITHLHRAMPDAKIDAYIWKDAASVLEGHPDLSEMILQDRSWKSLGRMVRLRNELTLLREIRARKYDLVVNLTEGDRGAIAAKFSGAEIRVGIDPGNSGLWGKKKLYTHIVKQCKTPRHTVEKDLDALRKIGIFPDALDRDLTFHIPDQAMQSAKAILESYGLEKGQFVMIHPVSRWLFKCLPPHLMAKIIDQLGERVVLTSGPSATETAILDKIEYLAIEPVVNLGGKSSLKELGALMSLCKGLITVDSVPLHIASALKTPTVALFGPTSEKNWGPWRNERAQVVAQNISCRPCHMDGCGGSKMSDCLYSLSPTQVVRAFEEVSSASAKASAEALASSAEASARSASSLFVLNSLETNFTE